MMHYSRNFYEIKPNDFIFEMLQLEAGTVGYYELPFQNIEGITEYAKTIKSKNIFVIGIGGSSLGAKAIYSFLKPLGAFKKNLIFLDTIDPLYINSCLNVNLQDAHFILISKSGDTIEPHAIFRYISSKIEISSANLTCITSQGNKLDDYAKNKNINVFYIPKNVGGRFSVFSTVGLIPLAIIGVDIEKILEGCREVHESFFEKRYYYDHIINKARFLVENKARFSSNIIFSYSSVFSDFNKWYVQLWAESLGKINKNSTRQGLTPVALLGPEDQHSFLQLIKDGVRNKTVTFFKIKNFLDKSIIPEINNHEIFDMSYLDNLSFNDLINHQADATYESILLEKDIPCDIVTIDEINEHCIGALMYRFQLLVSCIGAFLQINTYDQPAVEDGKEILKSKLKKQ